MEKINENAEDIGENIYLFCVKYGISEKMVRNYISSCEINDMPEMDTYLLIMENECSHELVKEMRKDLKQIVKDSIIS